MSAPRPLRVVLDATQVDNQNLGSGQFRYALDLLAGLSADDRVRVTLLGSTREPAEAFARTRASAPAPFDYVAFPRQGGRGYYYRDLARVSWWLARQRPDVFHQLHTNLPPIKTCPVVVTAYHYFADPLLFASRPYRYYQWGLRHRADAVIAISEATRESYHEHYRVPLQRIRTVYPGLSTSFRDAGASPARGRYLLSPYNLSLPKNLRSLILAWPEIAERDPEVELWLYGRAQLTPAAEAEFEATLRGLPHATRVKRLGHVTDTQLAALYAGCTVFVFPTTVEGFGYPLLEAMSQGACCLTRDASAMKEIGGEAVHLVETLDPGAIAAATIALLADPLLRARLGERARRRAADFTIDSMVRGTVECYQAVAGRA